MKILIVEDEINAREFLSNALTDIIDEEDEIKTSSNVPEALAILKSYNADLVLLDIQMPQGNGFELLEKCKNPNFKVIFTTAYDKYALKAIKFNALDYILKPIDIDELEIAINRVKSELEDKKFDLDLEFLKQLKDNLNTLSKIAVPYKNGFVFLEVSDISYVEADGSYTIIHYRDKEYIASKNIKHFEKLLEENDFCRIHASYIINLKQMKSFSKSNGGEVVLENDEVLSVSSSRRSAFLNRVNFK